MATAKVTINNRTIMDITDTTATASTIVQGYTAYGADGVKITGTYQGGGGGGNLQAKTDINPTTSSQTITPDTGYDGLSSVQINAMPAGSVTAPASISGSSASITTGTNSLILTKTVSVTPNVTTAGYVSSGTAGNSSISLTALATIQGATTYTPTTSSQTIPMGTYLTGAQTIEGDADLVAGNIKSGVTIFGVEGTYSGAGVSLQTKSVTPTESQQEVTPDSGYDGLSKVTVGAISSTYIGSEIDQRDETDLTAFGATVTVPAGYYSSQATKSVSTMTLPRATSGTSSGMDKATITPSTSAQYLNIPTGYLSTAQYYTISAMPSGSVTAPSSISGTSASISTGTNTLTLTKSVNVTPNVTTAGYISSGTAGNSSVSLTASVTVNPTPTASGATVTVPAGYYTTQTTKSVSSGSATGPSSITQSSATVTTGTNTITLTKTGVSTTPTVSAGYVSSATSSTATVALTASVTTKAAATITPTTTNQTIASGTYLTGTQTIAGDANLVAGNIKSGTSIFGVSGSYSGLDTSDATAAATDIVSGETAYVDGRKIEGSLVIQKYYTGSSVPASSFGNNGDIYFQS